MFRAVSLARLDHAFAAVRAELRELGLLDDGRYLDRIDCVRSPLPTLTGLLGYVYDRGVPWPWGLLGFRGGAIYLPVNAPVAKWIRGRTLVDVLRHEYGHAWAWLDAEHVDGPWFRDAFGARYADEWDDAPEFDAVEFISEYATTAPYEDFAETFMVFVRCRRSLERFRRRPGVYRKLKAVERAVKIAARERVRRVRGTRL